MAAEANLPGWFGQVSYTLCTQLVTYKVEMCPCQGLGLGWAAKFWVKRGRVAFGS